MPIGVRVPSGLDIGDSSQNPSLLGKEPAVKHNSGVPALAARLCREDAFPTVMLLTWPLR
jgi:hypothetical protein